jgi:hypothetical protein
MAWYTEVLQSEELTKLDLAILLSGSGSLSQTSSASVPPTHKSNCGIPDRQQG